MSEPAGGGTALALCAGARGVGASVCVRLPARGACVNVCVRLQALSLRTTGGNDMTALGRKKDKDL